MNPTPAATTAATSPPALARTGIDLVGLVSGAAILLAGGGVLWYAGKRHRRLHLRRH